MAIWTDYAIKDNPDNEDTLMVYDEIGNENKQLKISELSKKIVNDATEKQLNINTQDKTIPGAFNELLQKTEDIITGKQIVKEAETVNGHTVNSDVPANAVFTDTVYDDTKVREDIGQLKEDIGDVAPFFEYEIGFNKFDKRKLLRNHAYSPSKNGILVENDKYDCTPMLNIEKYDYLKMRLNQNAFRIITYDNNSNMIHFYEKVNGKRYAAYINATYNNNIKPTYVSFTFEKNDIDPETLMIALSNDTESNAENAWSVVFPNTEYQPYKVIKVNFSENAIIEDKLKLTNQKVEILNDSLTYTTSDFFRDMEKIEGVNIETLSDNTKILHIQGTTITKTWNTIYKPCKPCKVVLLEFLGKTSITGDGCMLIIEFLDKNGEKIGYKYNSYVLGTKRYGFHRYGTVSPYGCEKVCLRIATRANSDIYIKNISFSVIDMYPTQSGNRYHGHQGMPYISPKNTLQSFELAKIAGFNTVVTNVNVTSDGVLVALHDNTIDNTSNGTGEVSDLTYDQLCEYDFGSYFSKYYTGTKIPTFEEVIQLFSISGIRPCLSLHGQLDNSKLTEVCSILKKYGFGKKCLVKSFDFNTLVYMHNILGDGNGELEYFKDGDYSSKTEIDNIHENYHFLTGIEQEIKNDLNFEVLNYAKTKGLEVSAYFGNDMIEVQKLLKNGITRFCVDTFSDIVIPIE